MGAFGITIPRLVDTMTIVADGFYTSIVPVYADKYQTITLKARFAPAIVINQESKFGDEKPLDRWCGDL
jgi:hypothetical protein